MSGRSLLGSYLAFMLTLLGVVALLVAIGWLPTLNLAGEEGIPAMLLGICVSLLGSLAGGVPTVMASSRPAAARTNFLLGSLTLRLLLVLALTLAAVLALPVPRVPFLVWVMISYLALLPVDSILALRVNREG